MSLLMIPPGFTVGCCALSMCKLAATIYAYWDRLLARDLRVWLETAQSAILLYSTSDITLGPSLLTPLLCCQTHATKECRLIRRRCAALARVKLHYVFLMGFEITLSIAGV